MRLNILNNGYKFGTKLLFFYHQSSFGLSIARCGQIDILPL